ncbi:hypothetical protein ACIF8T_28675 [Streptomyces sp. NPDC085946]|uniref:hypothetical protein n=1 Tax=Streptomyces sp. NPDC085946 TaxID=3365744 RepID=UPI0037D6E1D3
MKKIMTLSATAMAAPAHVGGGGVDPAADGDFGASAVCLHEPAVVPVGGRLPEDVAREAGNVRGKGL